MRLEIVRTQVTYTFKSTRALTSDASKVAHVARMCIFPSPLKFLCFSGGLRAWERNECPSPRVSWDQCFKMGHVLRRIIGLALL